ARVIVDQTTLYTQPDRAAAQVGPLQRGQLVVVINEPTPAEGAPAWTQIPDGWIASADLAEDFNPWLAEVSVPSVSIYARPNIREPIRRTAKQGDLLRIAGVSPGIDGDPGTWWSTTEGYVRLNTVRAST